MTHGSEKRVRSTHITVRLAPEERAQIESAAGRAGLMVGSYVRLALLSAPAPRQVRRPPIERLELVRLLGEVGRVGNNLNQLAHQANAGMPVGAISVREVLDGLLDVRSAILIALGREP